MFKAPSKLKMPLAGLEVTVPRHRKSALVRRLAVSYLIGFNQLSFTLEECTDPKNRVLWRSLVGANVIFLLFWIYHGLFRRHSPRLRCFFFSSLVLVLGLTIFWALM